MMDRFTRAHATPALDPEAVAWAEARGFGSRLGELQPTPMQQIALDAFVAGRLLGVEEGIAAGWCAAIAEVRAVFEPYMENLDPKHESSLRSVITDLDEAVDHLDPPGGEDAARKARIVMRWREVHGLALSLVQDLQDDAECHGDLIAAARGLHSFVNLRDALNARDPVAPPSDPATMWEAENGGAEAGAGDPQPCQHTNRKQRGWATTGDHAYREKCLMATADGGVCGQFVDDPELPRDAPPSLRPVADPAVSEALQAAGVGVATDWKGERDAEEARENLLALSTCDPVFDPAGPVTVNGYRFVPVQIATASLAAEHRAGMVIDWPDAPMPDDHLLAGGGIIGATATLTLVVNGTEYRTQSTNVRGKLGGCPIKADWDGTTDLRVCIDMPGYGRPRDPMPIIYGAGGPHALNNARYPDDAPGIVIRGVRRSTYTTACWDRLMAGGLDVRDIAAAITGAPMERAPLEMREQWQEAVEDVAQLAEDTRPVVEFVKEIGQLEGDELDAVCSVELRDAARSLTPEGLKVPRPRTYTEEQAADARRALFLRFGDGDNPKVKVETTTAEVVEIVAKALGMKPAE
jgi:hypothetical protein